MNDEGTWQQEINLILTTFQDEKSKGFLPDVSGDEDRWQQDLLAKYWWRLRKMAARNKPDVDSISRGGQQKIFAGCQWR